MSCQRERSLVCRDDTCRRLSGKESGSSPPFVIDGPGRTIVTSSGSRTAFEIRSSGRPKSGKIVVTDLVLKTGERAPTITLSASSPDVPEREGVMVAHSELERPPDDAAVL